MIGENKLTFCFEDFYPSNIPYCHILKDIIEECNNRGALIEVITARKTNEEDSKLIIDFFETNNVRYTTFRLTPIKALNKLLFPFLVFWNLLLKGKGLVIITSTPPVLMGVSILAAKILGFSRFQYIYHCQDIHPEALRSTNIITNHVMLKILKSLDNKTVRNSKKTIVLSEDMKQTLLNRDNFAHSNISIINNFIPSAYSEETPNNYLNRNTIRAQHDKDDIIFVFAGNLGIFQNLEMLLEAFLKLSITQNIFLYFVGDGKLKKQLIKVKENNLSSLRENVHFIDKMSSNEIIHYISGADYGVVSLADGLSDVAYPSKIATYLNIGLPVFMCGCLKSNICAEIHDNDLGICSEGNSTNSIVKGMELAIKKRSYFINEHHKIKKHYKENYNRKKILSELIGEF